MKDKNGIEKIPQNCRLWETYCERKTARTCVKCKSFRASYKAFEARIAELQDELQADKHSYENWDAIKKEHEKLKAENEELKTENELLKKETKERKQMDLSSENDHLRCPECKSMDVSWDQFGMSVSSPEDLEYININGECRHCGCGFSRTTGIIDNFEDSIGRYGTNNTKTFQLIYTDQHLHGIEVKKLNFKTQEEFVHYVKTGYPCGFENYYTDEQIKKAWDVTQTSFTSTTGAKLLAQRVTQ